MEGQVKPRDAIASLERANPAVRDPSGYTVDESQLAAAHARVVQMIAAEHVGDRSAALPPVTRRSRRLRWTRVSAALAATAAGVSAVLLALPGQDQSGGLSLLDAAAKVAVGQPTATAVAPGEYFHMLVRDTRRLAVGGPLVHDTDREYWIAADGSGLVRQGVARVLYPGHACPPPAPTPRGYLSITCAPDGDMIVTDMRFGPGGFYSVYDRGVNGGGFAWVRSLPSDKQALEAALQRHWSELYAGSPVAPVARADSAQLLGVIGEALGDPITAPAVRGSLFRLAATLPGVSVKPGVRDRYGRTGTEISVTGATGVPVPPRPGMSPAIRRESSQRVSHIIFDPGTSTILDSDTTMPESGTGGRPSQGPVFAAAYFDQGTVGSLPR